MFYSATMAKRPFDQHLPTWVWTVAGLAAEGAEVRFFCPRCCLLFDVDLRLIERVRGRGFSLVHHTPRCKVSCCRSLGFFLAANGMHRRAVVLLRNDPKDSPWRPHWSFHAFEADMKARIGVDPAGEMPSTVARQTAAIPYRSG
ncbi:MAG TPA: hypothetical protein VEZ48_05945 [Sphingomonadaceae bacterium]|nr:hypothetical protein [Sphingomonadaceae bacterium]